MTSDFGSSGLTKLTVIDLFLKKTFTKKNKQTNPQSLFAGSFYLQVKMVLRPTFAQKKESQQNITSFSQPLKYIWLILVVCSVKKLPGNCQRMLLNMTGKTC